MRTIRITAEGFPQSYVPPPTKPVIVGDRVHVIESYGYHGTVATFEWFPNKRTWTRPRARCRLRRLSARARLRRHWP